MDATSPPASTPNPSPNSPTSSQIPTENRPAQRSLFGGAPPLRSTATNEELITFVNALNNNFQALNEHAVDICRRSTPSSIHYDNFDELSGAQLSFNVAATAIAATTDEISQADYSNGARPPPTITAILTTKARTELFRTYLSPTYITNLAKAWKVEYYNLTDITHDLQPRDLQLNVLCRGGEVVFNKLLTAIGTILNTVRVGHSERLLDIRRRLVTTDVASAYDECLNAILAALLLKVTYGTTKTSINALTLAEDWLTKDGRALLLHLHCLLANYPALDTEEYLNNAKALRVTESEGIVFWEE
ncbi:hypothetical protein CYMTET_44534 [Cymbomonas tetramitiformis]|uniref:Uncharacterized protein n=1 Tax=Cymbomonas tetramitiformis TaxID=36881 RepID=A0AAE0EZ78_9CHLO|nr:hypothetical protein CYMTET_44534 [Cymbomonas tetramitiformis]